MSDRRAYFAGPDSDEEMPERNAGIPEEKLSEVERNRAARSQNGASWGTLTLADFEDESATDTFTFTLSNGKTITSRITYDPNKVNDAALGDIRELSDAGHTLAAAEVFCRTVKDWAVYGPLTADVLARDEKGDLRYDDHNRPMFVRQEIVPVGEKVPLDPEVIQYMRSDIVLGIWSEINKAVTNQGKAQKDSRRGSRKR